MPLPLPSVFTSGIILFTARTANGYSAKVQLNLEVSVGNGPNLPTIYIWGTFDTSTVRIWVSALDNPDETDDDDWLELITAVTAATPPIVIDSRSVWLRAELESVGGTTSMNVTIL